MCYIYRTAATHQLTELEMIPNSLILDYDEFLKNPECFNDNRKELFENFTIIVDSHRFAVGWQWQCKHCGRIAISQELYFECKKSFVSTIVKCNDCHIRWELKIDTCASLKNSGGDLIVQMH